MADTCSTCRYFLVDGNSTICRRYPPYPLLIPASMVQAAGVLPLWPNPNAEAWCGEHRSVVAPGEVLRFPQRDPGDENPSGGIK